MYTPTSEQRDYMETSVRQLVKQTTDAIAEAARYGKCPADIRGALLMLMAWLRSEKRDFIEWNTATNYAHGEWLEWYLWSRNEYNRPRPENDGLSMMELYDLYQAAGNKNVVIVEKRGAA